MLLISVAVASIHHLIVMSPHMHIQIELCGKGLATVSTLIPMFGLIVVAVTASIAPLLLEDVVGIGNFQIFTRSTRERREKDHTVLCFVGFE